MLLLLLLPVRFDRVLREVLHELQGFLDLQQHFVSLTASHLGNTQKTGRMKSRRPGKSQSHLMVGGLCTGKYINSLTHICNMKTCIPGTSQPVIDTHRDRWAEWWVQVPSWRWERRGYVPVFALMLWTSIPFPAYLWSSNSDFCVFCGWPCLNWGEGWARAKAAAYLENPQALEVNAHCTLDLMHVSAPQSLTRARRTDVPSFFSAVISLLSSLSPRCPPWL